VNTWSQPISAPPPLHDRSTQSTYEIEQTRRGSCISAIARSNWRIAHIELADNNKSHIPYHNDDVGT
jgi:hypothetical protein